MTDEKNPFMDVNTLTGRLFMEADDIEADRSRARQQHIDNLTEDDMRRAFRIAKVDAPDQLRPALSFSTKVKHALGKFWSP